MIDWVDRLVGFAIFLCFMGMAVILWTAIIVAVGELAGLWAIPQHLLK